MISEKNIFLNFYFQYKNKKKNSEVVAIMTKTLFTLIAL